MGMSIFRAALLGLVLGAVAPLHAAEPSDVEIAQTKAMVEHLASAQMQGRAPGSAGIDKARDYLVERFQAAGLKPGVGEGYLQPFEVATEIEVTEQRLWFAGRPIHTDHYHPLGFGGVGEFSGEAVFVGYSVVDAKRDYDSYAGTDADDLKGKVFVMYRYEPQDDGRSRWTGGRGWTANAHLVSKVTEAQRRGAAAVVIVNPPALAKAQLHRAKTSTFGRRLTIPVVMADFERFRMMLAAAGRDKPTALAKRWQARADAGTFVEPIGLTIKGRVAMTTRQVEAQNIVGVLPGAGALAKQVIVLGAHYDHVGHGEFGSRAPAMRGKVHFGADDNASGAAALVLLAQRLARAAAADAAPADRRTLIFAGFSAEERGLIGSAFMVRNLDQLGRETRQIKAMLNLDMVGRLRENTLMISGVDTGDAWRKLVRRAAEQAGVEVSMGGSGLGPSDHASFYRAGVPALHFFTGFHLDYHTPADTADRINAAGVVKTADVVERVTRAIWADPVAVAYLPPRRGPGGAPRAVGANRAFLGVSPDPESIGGVVIDRVIPDAAAANAGLKRGDKIIAWNDAKIKNFYDLSAQLRDAEPGDIVELTIERGEKKLTYEVTLDER